MTSGLSTIPSQRGLLLTLEGIEGAGKTTQQRLLFNRLQILKIPTIITCEPGDTPIGAKIRSLLLRAHHYSCDLKTELMLYLADRAQHIAEVIIPALNRGETVICDRFVDSSEVYQGVAQGLDKLSIRHFNKWICADIWPDLTFLLDLEPEQGLKRVLKRQSILGLPLEYLESFELNFYYNLRRGFLANAIAEPERIKIINTSGTEEEIAEAIWNITKSLLKIRGIDGV